MLEATVQGFLLAKPLIERAVNERKIYQQFYMLQASDCHALQPTLYSLMRTEPDAGVSDRTLLIGP